MDTNNTINQNNGSPSPVKPKPKLPVFLVYFLVVFGGLLCAAAVFNFVIPLFTGNHKNLKLTNMLPSSIKLPAQKSTAASPAKKPFTVSVPKKAAAKENKPVPSGNSGSSYVLNGVFLSGNECYAIINNTIVKEGDTVEGATVGKITLDEVDLESDGKPIVLYSYTK
ncbi:MAG: hypothetical protein PHN57_03465 [Candidatus Omnitrophica bacterium]|nr:hypothetical protein [Candidatus Omnitrophota bacterium]